MATTSAPRPPTGDQASRAFGSAGLGPIAFVTPIHRNGPEWRFVADLPVGVTAADVVAKRKALARGLAVREHQLVVSRARGGPDRRIEVKVCDSSPSVVTP